MSETAQRETASAAAGDSQEDVSGEGIVKKFQDLNLLLSFQMGGPMPIGALEAHGIGAADVKKLRERAKTRYTLRATLLTIGGSGA